MIKNKERLPLLEKIRLIIGCSKKDFAKKIGIRREVYYAWLWGHQRPSMKRCEQLAELACEHDFKIKAVNIINDNCFLKKIK